MSECKHGIGRGYVCIDPDCPRCGRPRKVERVIAAARAWRNNKLHSVGALMDAVDALDAPVERYTVQERASATPWLVLDGPCVVSHSARQYDAEKIAAALNAKEECNEG